MTYKIYMDKDALRGCTGGRRSENVILYPEFKELKERADRLREELALWLERDTLRLSIKNMNAVSLAGGGLELARTRRKSRRQRKRKTEMIQARTIVRNRRSGTDRGRLELEFAEYKKATYER